MKQLCPDYYEKFRCTASSCKHNCCIGWEIDVDELSEELYFSVEGDFGKRLRESIGRKDDTAFFCLGENERCPFLNENNLCDIILNMGEDALCDICADHPRFRNFFSDREEIGLGLCCESAVELILKNEDKVQLVTLEDQEEQPTREEKYFFSFREKLFEQLQNREISIEERLSGLFEIADVKAPCFEKSEKAKLLLSLERLDEKWTRVLENYRDSKIKSTTLKAEEEWSIAFEQLLHYFIYRHLGEGLYDGKIKERLIFAVESFRFIKELCILFEKENGKLTFEALGEYVRLYSSEIEYSDENLNRLLEI